MQQLMFPKIKTKKKRKPHPESILQSKETRQCFICLLNGDPRLHPMLHEHHIFYGIANRPKSEQYGLKVYLCPDHHQHGPAAVHKNREQDLLLKRIAQIHFQNLYSKELFMMEFGKNYLQTP